MNYRLRLSTGLIMGIDPGFYDALSVYDVVNKEIKAMYDMPVHYLKYGNKERIEIDVKRVALTIYDHASELDLVVLEHVGPSPGAGTTAMFRFGQGLGILQGIITSNNLNLLFVRPNVWKPAMGLTADKDVVLARAKDLFGDEHFTLKKHHDRAEATFLAMYGAGSYL